MGVEAADSLYRLVLKQIHASEKGSISFSLIQWSFKVWITYLFSIYKIYPRTNLSIPLCFAGDLKCGRTETVK